MSNPTIEVRLIDGTVFRTDYYEDIEACQSAIVSNRFAGTISNPHGMSQPCTAWINRAHVVAIILKCQEPA